MSPVEWRPAWQRYGSPEARRGRTNDAITALEREGHLSAYLARFLRHLLDFANERGGTRIGAAALGEVLYRCKKRVLQYEAEACEQGWLQCIRRGGGKHRVNRFLFKIGVWRDDPADPHAQVHFSQRFNDENADADEALIALFREHLETGVCQRADCWVYAPREAKQPEIEWHRV